MSCSGDLTLVVNSVRLKCLFVQAARKENRMVEDDIVSSFCVTRTHATAHADLFLPDSVDDTRFLLSEIH